MPMVCSVFSLSLSVCVCVLSFAGKGGLDTYGDLETLVSEDERSVSGGKIADFVVFKLVGGLRKRWSGSCCVT